jgi:hypothetical protein
MSAQESSDTLFDIFWHLREALAPLGITLGKTFCTCGATRRHMAAGRQRSGPRGSRRVRRC